MTQYGFFFDQGRCSGCQACTVACKNWNMLPPGPLKYLRIYEYEKGAFPEVRIHFQWIPCYHCEEPACINSCPTQALYKEDKYGAVLFREVECDGCRMCYDACPYGAIVFESDDVRAKVGKCTMCVDRLDMGELPMCVISCPMRALDFGPLSELVKRHGNNRDLEDMPSSRTTRPSVIFQPQVEKKKLFAYDAERARELLMRRDPLPPVFAASADVTEIPEGMISADKLVVKHETAEDLMRRTRNAEG